MGPILIFDKSTLQSLNVDESALLDNFFYSNITPLFFIETLADLEKEVRRGKTPEEVVGALAYKTPDWASVPNVHHMTLATGELVGASEVDMRFGRPIRGGGRRVELAGKVGVVFQQSPEEEAFGRWHRMEFLDVERSIARQWRTSLSRIDLSRRAAQFKALFSDWKVPRSLSEAKSFVDFMIDWRDQEKVLREALLLSGIDEQFWTEILERWKGAGQPSLRQFAPYFAHVYSVDFFFGLAMSANLIGTGRPSHSIDMAYLYYLPFCMVFTSNDNLHTTTVPLFLASHQSFVHGNDLKRDLRALDTYFDALPDEVKATGLINFAHRPPHDTAFLVTRLWDKHMAERWRDESPSRAPLEQTPATSKLAEELRRLERDGTEVPDDLPIAPDDIDQMTIARNVFGRKGKWVRFSPEVLRTGDSE